MGNRRPGDRGRPIPGTVTSRPERRLGVRSRPREWLVRLSSGRWVSGRLVDGRVVALIHRGHGAVGVQPLQDRVGDRGQLGYLLGGEGVDHVPPDVGDVSRGGVADLAPPLRGQARVGRPGGCGQGNRSTRPRSSSRATTWERRGRVAFVCWASSVIRGVLGGLRQHREHIVLVVGQVRVAAELAVQGRGQQLEHGGQADPRRQLRAGQPRCSHITIRHQRL